MFYGIKSKYIINDFLKPILDRGKLLNLIKYNKKLKDIFQINIHDYKDYSKIIIELIPSRCYFNNEKFINYEQQYKPYFHVFFNDSEKEEKYPTNLNLGLLDSFKHFIKSNITNPKKEMVMGYIYAKQKIKK